jgi:hypothetical protein
MKQVGCGAVQESVPSNESWVEAQVADGFGSDASS